MELQTNDVLHWTSCEGWADAPPLAAKIENELHSICNRAIQLLGEHLIQRSTDTESTVALKKMLADHHRYIAEITHDDAKSKATENAQLTWQDHPMVLLPPPPFGFDTKGEQCG